jgi:hypothetical protein
MNAWVMRRFISAWFLLSLYINAIDFPFNPHSASGPPHAYPPNRSITPMSVHVLKPPPALRRLLKNRVRKLLGFQRLASIWQPPSTGKSVVEPVWLAEFKRDIA